MLESLIEQVAARFGIGADKVRQLLPMLTALMFNQAGGFSGFLDRFRQQGMGDIVQSWVGGGPNQPISPMQVESALLHFQAAAQAGLREVQQVGDQVVGPLRRALDSLEHGGLLFRRRELHEQHRAHADRRQRVAKVMADHAHHLLGNEGPVLGLGVRFARFCHGRLQLAARFETALDNVRAWLHASLLRIRECLGA